MLPKNYEIGHWASRGAAALCAGFAMFQAALVLGAPLGATSWGGSSPVLSPPMRAASAEPPLLLAVGVGGHARAVRRLGPSASTRAFSLVQRAPGASTGAQHIGQLGVEKSGGTVRHGRSVSDGLPALPHRRCFHRRQRDVRLHQLAGAMSASGPIADARVPAGKRTIITFPLPRTTWPSRSSPGRQRRLAGAPSVGLSGPIDGRAAAPPLAGTRIAAMAHADALVPKIGASTEHERVGFARPSCRRMARQPGGTGGPPVRVAASAGPMTAKHVSTIATPTGTPFIAAISRQPMEPEYAPPVSHGNAARCRRLRPLPARALQPLA